MTAPTSPYTKDLGDRDPLAAIRDTANQIHAVTSVVFFVERAAGDQHTYG
jgi:hypothetical protein